MRIKLDENLPARLASSLAGLGNDVDTVHAEGLTGGDDEQVWNAAQRNQRFVVTQDMDFSDVRRFRPGTHHGILLLRLRTPRRRALIRRIEELFRRENVAEWTGCFVVATDSKLRVPRPEGGASRVGRRAR